jgi:hypothetical protein
MSANIDEIKTALGVLDIDKARRLIGEALRDNPNAEIYYYAAQVALNKQQKLDFLKKCQELDPFYEPTFRELNGAGTSSPTSAVKVTPVVATPSPTTNPNVPALVTNPAAPSQITTQNEEPIYILGKVSNLASVSLYTIPHYKGTVCATIKTNSEVIMLARDHKAEWYNVIYANSLGFNTLGWLPRWAITNVTLNEQPVQPLDLPISQFENNSRDDVVDYLKLSVHRQMQLLSFTLAIIGFWSIMAGIGIIVEASSSYSYFRYSSSTSSSGGGYLTLLVGIVLFVAAIIIAYQVKKTGLSKEEIKRLERIRRSKQSGNENLREDVMRVAKYAAGALAGTVAAGAGYNMLMKSMPQKQKIEQDITVRHDYNKY